ncbi:3-hydroxyacyl-CoA dehydrogenase/enoyl-CoA hydratase family protein [Sphingobium algorifonticola]|uniref:3-hydroxyacyl-CoA dehydrogenase/enoyl-CoA hydratase family protein n=1 Tax=Sphingobium algorifonticola TaxID=2008318 RepID=A0A437JC58_9SPHN|nr:3-hydroxyacyl-CoA dehydrogenase/enoyl-CoA hydratase family protein [Sphingobium algorifonticola]RVT43212.1 3-hydroxyacyl-CoA dehydrogenase/enoyl-CoA hydratase family protein [Sphingobium algorifonticola]
MTGINKVCVIGAGTMGAGIAAQVANAGVPVLLLDRAADNGENRNAIAQAAIASMLKASPSPFMTAASAKMVEAGNIEDDLARIAECDWIVEAVTERIDVKQALYARIDSLHVPGSAISSNTSTIPLARLIEGRSDSFATAFLITHFFNPPRHMRLMELVAGPRTQPAVAARVENFIDRQLGKSVVRAKDSPGFIANRIGAFWLLTAVNAALDLDITIEEADAIGGRPMGIPATGIFGLLDLIGIDLLPLLRDSMQALLPPSDPFHAAIRPLPIIETMLAAGTIGKKSKGGFYRINREKGKSREAIDLTTGLYRAAIKPGPVAADLRSLIAGRDKQGAFAWAVLGQTLAYAASLVPEAADDIVAIDRAMKLGYNWKYGPFELIDRIGPASFTARLHAEGAHVPAFLAAAGDRRFYQGVDDELRHFGIDGTYHTIARPDGMLSLEDVKRTSRPLLQNAAATLWDIGDGIACFEFTSKVNAIDMATLALLDQSITLVAERMKAIVIYSDAANFSAGANLDTAVKAIDAGDWDAIEHLLGEGQRVFKAMKYAPFPVVGAPAGLALGGACELLLHADAIQAHAETYIGLVECGVGIIPGWGGCGELLHRWTAFGDLPRGPLPVVARAFEIISTATVSKSAAHARELRFLAPSDGITMNRDRLLFDAKAKAIALVENYAAPLPPTFRLPGPSGHCALTMAAEGFHRRGMATDYDLVVSDALSQVITGGEKDIMDVISETDMLALERRSFMQRVRDPRTRMRIAAMLETGKPVRN